MLRAKKKNICWKVIMEEGYAYYVEGYYNDAELLYKAALMIAEETNKLLEPSVGKLLFLFGDLCSARHHYSRAEKLYRHALALYELNSSIPYVDVAIVLKRLSEILRILGKSSEAIQLCQFAEKLTAARRDQLERIFKKKSVVVLDH